MLLDRVRERAAPPTQGFGATFVENPRRDNLDFRKQPADYLTTSNGFFAAANLRAKSVAKSPWQLEDESDDSATKDAPVLDLLRRPNKHHTANKLRRLTELALCIWGEYFWVLERGPLGTGRVREIWPVKPTIMSAIPSREEFLAGFVLRPPDGSKPIPFAPSEVVWFIQPDPSDEFRALSPLSAAMLPADTETGMMTANRQLFTQGMIGTGFVQPPTDQQTFSTEQAQELERELDKRFRGTGKAHRFAVMTRQFKLEPMNVSPKDAQFIEGLKMGFKQICRALGVPPELLADSEHATLANVKEFERALWEHTITDELDFIGAEVTRQLGPAFNLRPSQKVGFDLSGVVALQADENLAWNRAKEQLELGAIPINEWREEVGRDPVEWGAEPWFPRLVRQPGDEDPLGASEPERGSRIFRDDQYTAEENDHIAAMRRIFEQQEAEILRHMRAAGGQTRTIQSVADNPFQLDRWVDRTRAATNARYVAAVEKSILLESKALKLTPKQVAEALEKRATQAAMERQVRQFARQVNQTTWERVQKALIKSIRKGETLEQATSRVRHIMDIRAQDARRIAQTEITRAATTGQMAAYTTAGVKGKRWVTAGDDLVRETHAALHRAVIPVEDDFAIGIGHGPGPGQSGVAAEDIGCFPADTSVRFPALSKAFRRWWEGDLVVVETGLGRISGTPNHPVLTLRGWVPLSELTESDYLVRDAADIEWEASGYPYPQDRPARIDEVFRFAAMSGTRSRMLGGAEDFHGDGIHTDVDVVTLDRLLKSRFKVPSAELLGDFVLSLADVDERPLMLTGAGVHNVVGPTVTPNSVMGGSGKVQTLLRGESPHPDQVRFGTSTRINPGGDQSPFDGGSAYAERGGERQHGFPSLVTIDKVLRIDSDPFVGHVFNLESDDSGWYTANGVLVKNCRCTLQPVAAPKVLTEAHSNGHQRIDELGVRLLLESMEATV